ncbi:MAG TPA: bifunctional alpha,alpha-trehalose-phosphate synthase (UDP-forming)/trehalose-phosphatase, partial [Tepidisphaeraceae bacterium]|nr:bifunctional alpha,alpha-trehalose-phosphate synthase (UDP-forming)/trehalose-phosphatase [Tepidisphaeraceae bacterium]
MSSHRNTIIVSNRLPVVLSGNQVRPSSGGLVAALDGLFGKEQPVTWVGWPGNGIDDASEAADLESRLARDFGCRPVFLNRQEVAAFYEGFANSSVWPLLHYMPSRFRYHASWWPQYRKVNERFARKVMEVAQEGDLVWIHDYQLMLVPEMLRDMDPSLKIGFFLHTPFPSYETFRCHPRRRELVAGLLGADLIGFHTFGYLRHYCSSAMRLLGLESEITRIHHNGRNTALGVYPIGINAPRFEAELTSQNYAHHLDAVRRQHAGKRVVLCVERMDYTKGILQRLEAIELFLEAHQNADDVIFIFVSVPSREGVEQYRELREEVEARIGQLNGHFASLHNSPIHFIHRSVDFAELCALYSAADVAMVTPLIDGMNLVAKEYVACQQQEPGVLILSEFAGAATELCNALIVNPYDAQSVADSLEQALRMPREERRRRMEPMRQRVIKLDARHWARWFVHDLGAVPSASPDLAGRRQEMLARLGGALAKFQKVAMFLDYDGTLREIEHDPAAAKPNAQTHALLRMLRAHPGLDVSIISGRTPEDLDDFLGSYDFGLIAEHGAAIRRAGSGQWERLDRTNCGWKPQILKLLRLYESSTPGSFIEEKRTSLVWHYRNTDPVFGAWKARELLAELAALTA